MKYIMLQENINEGSIVRDIPFIFPEMLTHADVAEYVSHMLMMQNNSDSYNVTAISAGFCNVGIDCFGESETLNLSAREKDTAIINSYGYLHGIVL